MDELEVRDSFVIISLSFKVEPPGHVSYDFLCPNLTPGMVSKRLPMIFHSYLHSQLGWFSASHVRHIVKTTKLILAQFTFTRGRHHGCDLQ